MILLIGCFWFLFGWLQSCLERRRSGVGLEKVCDCVLGADRLLLEGVERGLEGLHVDAFDVEAEVLGSLELAALEAEADPDLLRELGAALEHLDELRAATREMRACAAVIGLRI